MLDTAWNYISIHAPVKGATVHPSHPGCPADISIHAPVKGATQRQRPAQRRHRISIHAPVKGATRRSNKARPRTPHFNPRSREGSDLIVMGLYP